MENNNYIPDQYKGALEKLNNEINGIKEEIITKDAKRNKISGLFSGFIKQNFPKGTNSADLIDITSAKFNLEKLTNLSLKSTTCFTAFLSFINHTFLK